MMHLRLYFLVLFSFIFIQLSAQSNKKFINGYILTAQGDTITGQIKDDGMENLSENVVFRKYNSETITSYGPSALSGFFFEPSFHFVSKRVKDYRGKKFFRTLVDGGMSLYSLGEKEDIKYLLVNESGENLLVSKMDSTVDSRLIEDRKFEGLLRLFFKECTDISQSKSKYKYTQKEMRNVVTKYNECQNLKAVDLGKPRPLRVSISFLNGFKRENVNTAILLQEAKAFETNDFNIRLGLLYGIRSGNKFSLTSGMLFNKSSVLGSNEFTLGELRSELNYSSLEIPIFVTYDLYSGKISPFINLGIRLSISTKSNLTFSKVFDLSGIVESSYHEGLADRAFGYDVGLGVRYQMSSKSSLSLIFNKSATSYSTVTELWNNNDLILDLMLSYEINGQ